ncbi:MAG: dipeptidase PepE [Bacteroidetes bacterium]|nr:dipeptidase PepE [Bacteroidota bacterium]MBP7398436.1 dipeptidase PepE [Chitinophagales bacterium]MBP8753333.1 dipeptidase PepE [Chitinophagales bacterium]MBP9189420.1 dipeptidase PepE [Chitinophagales bacterium]MBP9550035.1 dipeptidase PepE [Chitinophagales bacterium]
MNLIIASTSTIYGQVYLEYLKPTLLEFYKSSNEILFIPYARPSGISHEVYTEKASTFFSGIDKKLIGIHTFSNPVEAIQNAKAIFTGGGNTFMLLDQLYKNNLIAPLRTILKSGIPFLGTSAGSNITGLTIGTTNDMPVVYPPSFDALQLVPFNINPHFQDPIEGNIHMGETRETRIGEFIQFNTQPVIGLREGSWIHVTGNKAVLKGDLSARLFQQNQKTVELNAGSDLSFLL